MEPEEGTYIVARLGSTLITGMTTSSDPSGEHDERPVRRSTAARDG
jgi:hypothetical protein